MKYTEFNIKSHGFTGHMAEPDGGSTKAVIVIMGGEKSLLPGIKIAERFADYGYTGLAVSLFGASGLPDKVDRIPLEMMAAAAKLLKKRGAESISAYGISMGSIFAALTAQYVGGIDDLILCSPTHVPFEGTLKDKKTMTGHSVAVFNGREIPFVSADFSSGGMGRYVFDSQAGRKVTKMWCAYRDAYLDKERESRAALQLEKTGSRILLIAGDRDEAWPSDYSVNYIFDRLKNTGYDNEYKKVIYKSGSHLIGLMPNRDREKLLYRMIPVIGLMYRSFHEDRRACMKALVSSEKQIISWLDKKS